MKFNNKLPLFVSPVPDPLATAVDACSRSSENMPRTRLAGELRKVRTGAHAGLPFCRLPLRPQGRSGLTDTELMAEPTEQDIKKCYHYQLAQSSS